MTMLLQILAHTPRWVFALFALLVCLGGKQLLGGTVGLTRTTVMPIAMAGFAVYGVASVFGDSPVPLLCWFVAALATMALVLQRPLPRGVRYDAASRQFHLPGSAVPLVLMMGIFFTKYVVGVLLVMHPELAHQALFADGIPLLYGAFSGIFAGRALRLWKLALRQDRDLTAANAA